jgi:hypothetical protein
LNFEDFTFEAKVKVVKDHFCVSNVKDSIPKSHIYDLDEKEIEHVNKRGCKASKHVESWAKNAFNEWRVFYGFNTKKSSVDLSKDENFVMDIVKMLSCFVLQVVRKGW